MRVVIDHLGASGDGVALTDKGKVFVPLALPSEEVEVQILPKKGDVQKAKLLEILSPSKNRVQPKCPHFDECGGCSLQHLDSEFYQDFKRQKIQNELQRHGLDVPVEDGIFIGEKTRRRTTLKAEKFGKKLVVGYYKKASHDLFDIKECLVLEEKIEKLIPQFKTMLDMLLKPKMKADLIVTSTAAGVDVKVKIPKLKAKDVDFSLRENLAKVAGNMGLCRLLLEHEFEDPIAQFKEPYVEFSGVRVPVSAQTFLQASVQADEEIAEFVRSHVVAGAKKIADLFCGRGTLSFAVPDGVEVVGYEADQPSLKVLEMAAKSNKRNVLGECLNLFSDPLLAKELNEFDVVMLDPPRAGAKAQVEELARSQVTSVLSVSCNPATFARDAKILVDGGYKLDKVIPLDQFVYSSHVEVLAMFSK